MENVLVRTEWCKVHKALLSEVVESINILFATANKLWQHDGFLAIKFLVNNLKH